MIRGSVSAVSAPRWSLAALSGVSSTPAGTICITKRIEPMVSTVIGLCPSDVGMSPVLARSSPGCAYGAPTTSYPGRSQHLTLVSNPSLPTNWTISAGPPVKLVEHFAGAEPLLPPPATHKGALCSG
jgi:hypothetical protein